ncbi:hypothetical protein CEE44_00575 [Candidatus Woesearchaeota archaeon B3_Woes]|nr:MAG: hypothetical protein CEE44_00575 [Candidatus Woesearchaeota archaeon B3_Woes]
MAVIGLDIGGTKIKAGVVSNNRILKKLVVKTGKTKKEVINNILSSVDSLFDKKITAIGIGCPGPADYNKGLIKNTTNLPLEGVNIKNIISKRFRKKTLMENDANCFVLGESIRLKKKNIIGLTLGTGIGGGIVINNKLYKGKGNAGELGHCTIKFDGLKDKFGKGNLEAYLSSKAIKKRYNKEPSKLSKKDWNDYGKLLGTGIVNLAHTFDPDIIVIGGGISKAFNSFKSSMNNAIKKRTKYQFKVIKGYEDSGILGAAAIVK